MPTQGIRKMIERDSESVGIDLGTTYSSLAYVDAGGIPRLVLDSSGQNIVPSVIYFDEEEIHVGDNALQQFTAEPKNIAQFIKCHMGTDWRREAQGHIHTPESLSAIILKYLVQTAESQIGPVRSAVITVPAYFTEKRRRATHQAGEIAGLQVMATLSGWNVFNFWNVIAFFQIVCIKRCTERDGVYRI